jgi:probable F420-dependent oxidoreductase
MELGVFGLNKITDPEALGDLAVYAERSGLAAVFMGEHMVYPTEPGLGLSGPEDPILDPLVALSFVAARTTTMRLGTGILLLPQRHPVHLAKELASLDRLSGGRLLLGIGVGYLEAELRALGVDPATRGVRADEYLAAMRELWASPTPRFAGRFVSFDQVDAHPRPLRPQGPPILVGGHGAAAYRRAATAGDGWYGFLVDPAGVREALGLIVAAGRARDRFDVTVTPAVDLNPSSLADYAKAGVDRLVVWPRTATGPQEFREAIDGIAQYADLARRF